MPVTAIDYEVEYNNRARVPEHEEIFARWAWEGENYRAETLKAGRAQLGLCYGDTPRQSIDLFLPEAGETAPLALFIHGGWWRSLDASMFSQMARGPNAHGVMVAVAGYDLCPNVTIGDIVEQMRRACLFLWQRFNRRLFVYGHSAGGHLAGAMLATDWAALYPKVPADLVPAGYAVSGVFNLGPLVGISVNQDSAAYLRGGTQPLAAVLAGQIRTCFRCRRRRSGVERIQTAEPDRGTDLAAKRSADALRRDRRHQSFHRDRQVRRSAKRDDGTRG
jgi:arylformamidase